MIVPSWKNLVAIVMIFLTGAVFGALLFPRLAPLLYLRSGPAPREILRRVDFYLARQLDLSPSQREQIRHIIEETREEINRIREENQPQLRAILAQSRERIQQQLTPEQQKRYSEMIQRQKRQWEKSPLLAP